MTPDWRYYPGRFRFGGPWLLWPIRPLGLSFPSLLSRQGTVPLRNATKVQLEVSPDPLGVVADLALRVDRPDGPNHGLCVVSQDLLIETVVTAQWKPAQMKVGQCSALIVFLSQG